MKRDVHYSDLINSSSPSFFFFFFFFFFRLLPPFPFSFRFSGKFGSIFESMQDENGLFDLAGLRRAHASVARVSTT